MTPSHRANALRASAFRLALLLLAALCAGGCARRERAGAHASAAGGVQTIDYWNGFTGPDGKTMEALVRRFERENPDVRVRMQIIPWGTYFDKLTLSLAYGGAPEVFIVPASRLPEYASFKVLNPLAPLIQTAQPPLPVDDFAPVPWKASFYEKVQYGLPLDVHPLGLYYNARLFREAGIVDARGQARPPTNWEEFVDAAKRLTKDTNGDGRIDQWGFMFTNQRSNWLTFVYQHGGDVLTPDGKETALQSPAVLEATQKMHDLVYKYRVAPKPEGIDAWMAFRQGRTAMALEGIYMLASLQEQKGLEYRGAPAPQFGPVPATWGGSHLLCQPAGISPEAARAGWRLMRFLSDNSIAWAEGGQVPARLSARNAPAFQKLTVQAQFARQLPYVRYEPLHPKANGFFPHIDPAVESVQLDMKTPAAAMAEASRRVEQVLERP